MARNQRGWDVTGTLAPKGPKVQQSDREIIIHALYRSFLCRTAVVWKNHRKENFQNMRHL